MQSRATFFITHLTSICHHCQSFFKNTAKKSVLLMSPSLRLVEAFWSSLSLFYGEVLNMFAMPVKADLFHHCRYVCVMSSVCDTQVAAGTVKHNGSSVCVWCQETRSHLSLVSSVFPDGRVRVRGKLDERACPVGWHSFHHATFTVAP